MHLKLPGKIIILLLTLAVVFAGGHWWNGRNKIDPGKNKIDPGKQGGGEPVPPGDIEDKGLLGRPLRVGVVYWPGYAGGLVANNGFAPNKSCLFWNNHKLQVEFVDIEDPDQLTAAFQKGGPDGIDIMWSTVDSWANSDVGLSKGGLKAKAIMQVDWSRGGDAIVADNSIRAIEDLRGKKLALIQYTPSHWLLEYSLDNSSLNDADKRAIETSLVNSKDQEAGRDAFLTNQVPAAVLWEPYVTEALKRPNSHVLFSSATANKMVADIMIAKQDFIEQHPDVAQAFVSGWMEGATDANRNTTNAVKLLMENEPPYKAAGEAATRDGLSKVRLADLSDNTGMFGLDGKPSDWDRIFKLASERWLSLGVIPKTLTPAEAKDDRFARKLYQETPVTVVAPKVQPIKDPNKPAAMTKQVRITFASGSATLDENAKTILQTQVVTLAQGVEASYLNIEGNTDNVGDPARNRSLSLQRAQAVVDYLKASGIDPHRMTAKGNGPDKSVAPNTSEDGRSKNRRTDIKVIPR